MEHARQVGLRSRGGGDLGRRHQMARMGASQMEFSLQVSLSDLSIEQRHFRRRVAEQFHEGGKAHARSQHLSGKSAASRTMPRVEVLAANHRQFSYVGAA